MKDRPVPNSSERLRWNDRQWTRTWLERQALTAFSTEALVAHLAPEPGERILEVGSGTGRLSATLAEIVGPTGAVLGVDLSEELTALATERGRSAGLDNLTFLVADAQVESLSRRVFDAVASQFGVMFFEDPEAAFANLARHLAPGGRLGFVTWQPAGENPWYVMDAVAPFLEESRRPDPAARTGPFSMADPGAVGRLLAAAGWTGTECTPYRATVVVDRAVLIAEGGEVPGVAESDRLAALAAMEARLEPFVLPGGRYEVPIAFLVFTARRS